MLVRPVLPFHQRNPLLIALEHFEHFWLSCNMVFMVSPCLYKSACSPLPQLQHIMQVAFCPQEMDQMGFSALQGVAEAHFLITLKHVPCLPPFYQWNLLLIALEHFKHFHASCLRYHHLCKSSWARSPRFFICCTLLFVHRRQIKWSLQIKWNLSRLKKWSMSHVFVNWDSSCLLSGKQSHFDFGRIARMRDTGILGTAIWKLCDRSL